MPVYKEDLDEVIALSYFNVRKAMDYYESKGGETKFIICDDGFQVIKPEEAVKRANFYHKHGIAFVARPPENRRGVFKKASNLNYQLHVSARVTDMVQKEDATCERALDMVWLEKKQEFAAGGDLTLDSDSLILLIDADTKVRDGMVLSITKRLAPDCIRRYVLLMLMWGPGVTSRACAVVLTDTVLENIPSPPGWGGTVPNTFHLLGVIIPFQYTFAKLNCTK
jgi:hypothetical protein